MRLGRPEHRRVGEADEEVARERAAAGLGVGLGELGNRSREGRGAGVDLLWAEDAAPYDQLSEVAAAAAGAPLAAGESLTTVGALADLRTSSGMDYLLLDVQMLGGPTAFLAAARSLQRLGARIGAHIFTPHSTHLLACVDDPLPVEVFDWSDPLMEEPPRPDEHGRLRVTGPGFGVTLDRQTLERLATLPPLVL